MTDPRITRTVITAESLRADVERVLREEGTDWERFVTEGRSEGGHENQRLREVWLLAGIPLASGRFEGLMTIESTAPVPRLLQLLDPEEPS